MTDEEILNKWADENTLYIGDERLTTASANELIDLIRRVREDERKCVENEMSLLEAVLDAAEKYRQATMQSRSVHKEQIRAGVPDKYRVFTGLCMLAAKTRAMRKLDTAIATIRNRKDQP